MSIEQEKTKSSTFSKELLKLFFLLIALLIFMFIIKTLI